MFTFSGAKTSFESDCGNVVFHGFNPPHSYPYSHPNPNSFPRPYLNFRGVQTYLTLSPQ